MNPMQRASRPVAAAALALAAASPALAATPTTIFDSGTPTSGTGFGLSLNSVDWLAEQVHLDAGTSIGSVATFLAGAQPGETFTIAMYADRVKGGTDLPDTRDGGLLFSTQVTFGADGWNGATGLDWNVAAAGDYWFAVEVTDADTLAGSDNAVLPIGAPNAPLAVAYTDSSAGRFYSLGSSSAAYAFGLQVSTVPEPSSVLGMLAGLGVLAGAARRRRG